MRVERELRHKDLELGKLKFDLKTTDVNELKLAVEVDKLYKSASSKNFRFTPRRSIDYEI